MVAYIRGSRRRIKVSDFLATADLIQQQRDFTCLQQITDAYLQYQREHPEVRRRCAQALIEEGHYTAAIDVLTPIVRPASKKKNSKEYYEGLGLSGRVSKQLYLNSTEHRHPVLLEKAITAYQKGYGNDPKNHSWHGINAAALLTLASRDRVRMPNIKAPKDNAIRIAKQITDQLGTVKKATVWDMATIAEAHLVLGDQEAALRHYVAFANDKNVTAFTLGSALRQLEEVWHLGAGDETARMIVESVRAALLKKHGGQVDLFTRNIDSEALHDLEKNKTYEKVLGKDAFNSYRWFVLGTDRAHNVAQIETAAGKAFGTGFLVRGGDICDRYGDDQLFFTNAHVITKDGHDRNALSKDQARVRFELSRSSTDHRVAEIVWHSPKDELDATLVRLDKVVDDSNEVFPISRIVPLVSKRRPQRVYIIGHPDGMRLQFSMKDNALLDAKDPFIHYRAPTMGGSSGSPVFNEEWELIGLHHAGGFDIPKLTGEGTHDANEGITMRAILDRAQQELNC
jgi:V8-like Glu-specific endopeptidase